MERAGLSRARPSRRRRRMPVERRDPLPEERCYLCDAIVTRTDEIVRVHEATMHRRCYEQDIRRGR
jgi:hypothetical protein